MRLFLIGVIGWIDGRELWPQSLLLFRGGRRSSYIKYPISYLDRRLGISCPRFKYQAGCLGAPANEATTA